MFVVSNPYARAISISAISQQGFHTVTAYSVGILRILKEVPKCSPRRKSGVPISCFGAWISPSGIPRSLRNSLGLPLRCYPFQAVLQFRHPTSRVTCVTVDLRVNGKKESSMEVRVALRGLRD